MNKNTLVIIYWNLGIGGIQKRIRDLVIEISHTHPLWNIIILQRKTLPSGFQKQIQDSCKTVSIQTYPCSEWSIRPIGGFLFWLLIKYAQLKPTICLTFLPMLGTALCAIHALFFWIHTKLIINEGVVLTEYLSLHKLTWLRPLITITYNQADRIIVPTDAARENIISSFSIDPTRVIVLPNWTLVKKQPILKNISYDLSYIGRFEVEKNILILCDVIQYLQKEYPDIHLIMVGEGSLLPAMQSKILELKLEKNIYISKFTVLAPSIIRSSKILILPSISEGMPNVVLEAAMMKVPSVLNNFRGSDEVVIHQKTGYIASSTREIATYARALLSNEKKRISMGQNAYNFVKQKFSSNAQKKFIKEIFS